MRAVVQQIRDLRTSQREVLLATPMPPEVQLKFTERLDELGDTATALERQLQSLAGDLREQAAKEASAVEDPMAAAGHFAKAPPPQPPSESLPAGSAPMDLTGGDAPGRSFEERFPTLSAATLGGSAMAGARAKRNKQPARPKPAPKHTHTHGLRHSRGGCGGAEGPNRRCRQCDGGYSTMTGCRWQCAVWASGAQSSVS